MKQDYPLRAEAAQSRAEIYALLLRVFANIPDTNLLQEISSNDFGNFLDICCSLDDLKFKGAVANVKSYCDSLASREPTEILNELSVDRTGLLIASGNRDLKPPYEGLYRQNDKSGRTSLEVRDYYRERGLLPDESVHELMDYLCVELAFLYQLCLRESQQWASGRDASATVADEVDFLREHLASWIGEYRTQAEKYARTDFYRGFLEILTTFIEIEVEYLQSQTSGS